MERRNPFQSFQGLRCKSLRMPAPTHIHKSNCLQKVQDLMRLHRLHSRKQSTFLCPWKMQNNYYRKVSGYRLNLHMRIYTPARPIILPDLQARNTEIQVRNRLCRSSLSRALLFLPFCCCTPSMSMLPAERYMHRIRSYHQKTSRRFESS